MRLLKNVVDHYESLARDIRSEVCECYERELDKCMSRFELKELNRNREGIRTNLLATSRYSGIQTLRHASWMELTRINGIGEKTARKIVNNVRRLEQEVVNKVTFCFDPNNKDEYSSCLLFHLYVRINGTEIVSDIHKLQDYANESRYGKRLKKLKKSARLIYRIFWTEDKRDDYLREIDELEREIKEKLVDVANEQNQRYQLLTGNYSACWNDFIEKPQVYYNMVKVCWPSASFTITSTTNYFPVKSQEKPSVSLEPPSIASTIKQSRQTTPSAEVSPVVSTGDAIWTAYERPISLVHRLNIYQGKKGKVDAQKLELDSSVRNRLLNRYIAFDVETTGLKPTSDRIIELGAVLVENGQIVKSFGTLVRSVYHNSISAQMVNHITDYMLKMAPTEGEVYPEFIKWMGDALQGETIICAHNARFDINFLSITLSELGYDANIQYVDTLWISKRYIKLRSYKQGYIAAQFGIPVPDSHRAEADARVCAQILWKLLSIHDEKVKSIEALETARPYSKIEEEMCSRIRNVILSHGGDDRYLSFKKSPKRVIEAKCMEPFTMFRATAKEKYFIVPALRQVQQGLRTEPCSISEGGKENKRVYITELPDIDLLDGYIWESFQRAFEGGEKVLTDIDNYGAVYRKEAETKITNMESPLEHEKIDVKSSLDDITLSKEQEMFIQKALEGHNILVDACIGSGKTTAIQRLCYSYPAAKKILYLTYNRLLKFDAKSKIKRRNVTVTNYHGYASYRLSRMNIRVGMSDMIQTFLRERPPIAHYDVLIIDEYQDIELELSQMLEMIKEANPGIQIVMVGDMQQKIYDKTTLKVTDFVKDFLGEHITMEFTQCFRLSSSHAAMLGRIWKKKIVGVNESCQVKYMKLREVQEFLSTQEPADVLCLGAREGKMADTLNYLESYFPNRYNKRTVFASIADNDTSANIEPDSSSAIFTTYDSSKGLERKIVALFDFTEDYWAFRMGRTLQSYEILRNIFCVGASRGKGLIIIVEAGVEKLLSEKTLSTPVETNLQFLPFGVGISGMFDFKYKEDVERCFALLKVKELSREDTTIIAVKSNDDLIDLSPCIGIYQEASFFKGYSVDERIRFYLSHNPSRKRMLEEAQKAQELEMKVLCLAAYETKQERYVDQVKIPFINEAEKKAIYDRLATVFHPNEMVQTKCGLYFADSKSGNLYLPALGMTDVIKDGVVYELKFVIELMHEHFLQCACYMVALGLEKGILWNTRDNSMYEIHVPDKKTFLDAVVATASKHTVNEYNAPAKQEVDNWLHRIGWNTEPITNMSEPHKEDERLQVKEEETASQPNRNEDVSAAIQPVVCEPKDARQLWKTGEALRIDGEIEKAIALFDQAKELGYKDPLLYMSFAMAYRSLKKYEEEILILDELLSSIKRGNDRRFYDSVVLRKNRAIDLLWERNHSEISE